MVDVLADRYELRATLGSGGMAHVFEAFDRVLHRRVAVKVLREVGPVERERLLREARSAARLSHPNAVAVFDTGDDDGLPYIVMELVDGPSLADVLRDGPLERDRAVEVATQVLDALAAAHVVGLVHRDVKPGNILLPPGGGAKLADFGIAKALHDTSATLTGTGEIIGTPRYLSPEQVAGQPADARSDVYAVGVVAYEMLAGRPPFDGPTPLATAVAHQRDEPPPLDARRPGLDPGLVAVVHRALAKDPDERFGHAADMRRALRDPGMAGAAAAAAATVPLGDGLSAGAEPTAVLPADGPPGSARRRTWTAVAALAAFVLVAALGYAATRGPDGQATAPPIDATDREPTPTAQPVEEEGPPDEPAEPVDEQPTEPDSLAGLVAALAEDPDRAGEKGPDLFDRLVEVSREEPGEQPKKARETINDTQKWLDEGKLSTEVGALAIRLLEPLTAGEADGPPRGSGEDRGQGRGRNDGDDPDDEDEED